MWVVWVVWAPPHKALPYTRGVGAVVRRSYIAINKFFFFFIFYLLPHSTPSLANHAQNPLPHAYPTPTPHHPRLKTCRNCNK